MLSIRLRRIGKRGYPTYRIIVLEKHKDPFGDFLEDLGFYDPHGEKPKIELKTERIKHWIEKGAQASPTVHNLLVNEGILKGSKKKAVSIKKKSTSGGSAGGGKEEVKKKEEQPKES